ncbi:unnamed protein product [Withania somnifera]
MAHGKRRAPEANNRNRRPKSLGIDKKSKPKAVSVKHQIRSVQRMLRKDLPPDIREAQKQKLEELNKQQELQNRLAVERKIFLRNRKVKFLETGSEDDGLLDLSDDDFFESGSSSDDADDEWTDKSAREQASSASGKAASSMSSDERNQRQISARALMPPPRPSSKSFSHSANKKSRFGGSTSKKSSFRDMSTSSNTSDSINRSTFRKGTPADSLTGKSGNISSNSDARKPRRKRRPKKKKQQA